MTILYIDKKGALIQAENNLTKDANYNFYFPVDHVIVGIINESKLYSLSGNHLTPIEQYLLLSQTDIRLLRPNDYHNLGRKISFHQDELILIAPCCFEKNQDDNNNDIEENYTYVPVDLQQIKKLSFNGNITGLGLNVYDIDQDYTEEYYIDNYGLDPANQEGFGIWLNCDRDYTIQIQPFSDVDEDIIDNFKPNQLLTSPNVVNFPLSSLQADILDNEPLILIKS